MNYRSLRIKKPYKQIIKITICSIIFLLGIMVGIFITNIKNSTESFKVDSSIIDEYTCANGDVHKFVFKTRNDIRKSNGSKVEVMMYMCKKCGYDKTIVVE